MFLITNRIISSSTETPEFFFGRSDFHTQMAVAIVNSDFSHNVRNGFDPLRFENFMCSHCQNNFPIRQVVTVNDNIDFGHAGAWDSVDSSLSSVSEFSTKIKGVA